MCIGVKRKTQRVRDPLHNLVEFDTGTDEFEDVLWRVIQTQPFQRLRRIKQLGFSDFVYPGATHSRLAHSIGVFFTARRLMDIIRRYVVRPEESKIRSALAGALVHDLGHGPFSHAFESVGKSLNLKMAVHEKVSDAIIRDSEVSNVLNELGRGFSDDVADVIQGSGKKNVYRAVVSSQFDADRLDYMQRDRLMTGSEHAAIDFEWLLANLEIAKLAFGVDERPAGEVETFVLGPKAVYAADAFVLGLFQLYPTVYFHKATRGAEKIFAKLLMRIVKLVNDDSTALTGLPDKHPLVRFAERPDSLDAALALDDTVVWGALPLMKESSDPLISQFSDRLLGRNLYKSIDVRTPIAHALDPEGIEDDDRTIRIDTACTRVNEKLTDWVNDSDSVVPRILPDAEKRSPYKSGEESDGPLDRINIRTADDELVDLQKRSKVVAALKPFKFSRAYVSGDDTEAREIVDSIIQGEIAACQR